MHKLENMNSSSQKLNTQDFSHIKDEYFRQKLVQGLVPYEPKLWATAQMDAKEERSLR
jgi:hypothetical protein